MVSDMLTVPEASAVTDVPIARVNAMIDDGSLPLRVIVRKKGQGPRPADSCDPRLAA